MSNIALRINGPATVTYKGVTFYSQAAISLVQRNDPFDIVVNRFGVVRQRRKSSTVSLSFIPDGRYTAFFGTLFPYGAAVPGAYTTPIRSFLAAAVTIGTETINLPLHPFLAGDAVRLYSFGTIPAGITAGTRYFVGVVDANNIRLFTTRANALTLTTPLDITSQGTGEHRIIAQEQLTILSSDGSQYVFDVAAVSEMPDIIASTTETLFGAVTFDLFRGANIAATTANSLFTLTTGVAFTEPGLDGAQILTQPYTFTWGAAPWVGLETVNGFRWSFPMSTEEVGDNTNGPQARRITNIGCRVSCQPIGLTEQNVIDRLAIQGAGAQIGAELGGVDDFVMTGTGVTVTAKGAGLLAAPTSFDRSADRIGELEFVANRTFAGAVANPMFIVA